MVVKSCIVASFITNNIRLLYFQAMIRSWQAQSVPVDLLLIMSASSVDLLTKSIAFLNTLDDKSRDRLKIIIQDGSQFQKLAMAILKCNDILRYEDDDWITFSDDDDLWHPDRNKVFTNCTEFALPCTEQIRVFVAAEVILKGSDTSKAEKVLSTASISNTEQYVRLEMVHNNLWTFAVKYKLLKEFFVNAHVNLLQHKFCDYAFTAYLLSSPRIINSLQILPVMYQDIGLDADNWMYFFRLNRDCEQICVSGSTSKCYDGCKQDFQVTLFTTMTELLACAKNEKDKKFISECVTEVNELLKFTFEKLELQYIGGNTSVFTFDQMQDWFFSQRPMDNKKKGVMIKVLSKLQEQMIVCFYASLNYLKTLQPPRHRRVNLDEIVVDKNGVKRTFKEALTQAGCFDQWEHAASTMEFIN